jgi:hypothetical protein
VSPESERLGKALELLSALVVFYLVGVVWGPLDFAPLVGEGLSIGLGLIVGVSLPIFVYGKPQVSLRWQLRNEEVEPGVLHLDFSSSPVAHFIVDATVTTGSVLAHIVMKNSVRRGTNIVVQLSPQDVLRMHAEPSSGGAQVNSLLREIVIPIDKIKGLQSGRAAGKFVPQLMSTGRDALEIVEFARSSGPDAKRQWIGVCSPFKKIRTRG